jgi:hypothetical protein
MTGTVTDATYVAQPIQGHGQIWVPESASVPANPPTPQPVPLRSADPAKPNPYTALAGPNRADAASDRRDNRPPEGGMVMTVGGLSMQSGIEEAAPPPPANRAKAAPAPAKTAAAPAELPEGVMARVSNGMAAAIGTVAAVAMAEAAFNLGRFVYKILELPIPLAVGFPAIFEAAAASFAVQDMRDRRAGHANLGMRVATYLTLTASSLVNGIVGWVAHGGAGLIEVLPPLVLAGVIHLHGDRATRAHHSQAVLRPAWKLSQLQAARRESVLDVLPLLAGDDEDGRATVALLRRRLESHTLEPGDALLAAGWHNRGTRGLSESQMRRLEIVAATVWGTAIPASPAASPAAPATDTATVAATAAATRARTPARNPATTPAPNAASTPVSTPAPSAAPTPAPDAAPNAARTPAPNAASAPAPIAAPATDGSGPDAASTASPATDEGPLSVDDATLAAIVAQVRAGKARAGEGSVRQVLRERNLSAGSRKIRAALAEHASSATPPQLTLLHPKDAGPSDADSESSPAAEAR